MICVVASELKFHSLKLQLSLTIHLDLHLLDITVRAPWMQCTLFLKFTCLRVSFSNTNYDAVYNFPYFHHVEFFLQPLSFLLYFNKTELKYFHICILTSDFLVSGIWISNLYLLNVYSIESVVCVSRECF